MYWGEKTTFHQREREKYQCGSPRAEDGLTGMEPERSGGSLALIA